MVISKISESASASLDLMRLLLAQAVVLGHAVSFYGLFPNFMPSSFPWIQSVAVVGFFVLSGFVITYSTVLKCNKKPSYSFKEFFIERFSRIYAALVPALLFVYCIDTLFIYLFPEQYRFYYSYDWLVALKNILMLEKFPIGAILSPMFGSASTWWSLAIEWWFYMFFGWLILKNKIKLRSSTYMLVGLVFALVPLKYMVEGQSTIAIGITYVWLSGAGVVFLKEWLSHSITKVHALGLGILFFVFAGVRYQSSGDAFDLLAALNLSVSFLFMLVFLDKVVVPLLLRFRVTIHFIASYSLTLYLTHYSILWFIYAMALEDSVLSFILGVVISNLVAICIAVPTEMKYHKLSKYLKLKFVR